MTKLNPIAGEAKIMTKITNPDRGFNVDLSIEGLPTTNLIPFNTKGEDTLSGVTNTNLEDTE